MTPENAERQGETGLQEEEQREAAATAWRKTSYIEAKANLYTGGECNIVIF